MRIGMRFCGNCNPAIDSRALVKELARRRPGAAFLGADASGLDALLLISACAVDCVTRQAGRGVLTVAVAGESVNCLPCPRTELPERILSLL